MATKKQKRAAGLAKRAEFEAKVKESGLKAQAEAKAREAELQEITAQRVRIAELRLRLAMLGPDTDMADQKH